MQSVDKVSEKPHEFPGFLRKFSSYKSSPAQISRCFKVACSTTFLISETNTARRMAVAINITNMGFSTRKESTQYYIELVLIMHGLDGGLERH